MLRAVQTNMRPNGYNISDSYQSSLDSRQKNIVENLIKSHEATSKNAEERRSLLNSIRNKGIRPNAEVESMLDEAGYAQDKSSSNATNIATNRNVSDNANSEMLNNFRELLRSDYASGEELRSFVKQFRNLGSVGSFAYGEGSPDVTNINTNEAGSNINNQSNITPEGIVDTNPIEPNSETELLNEFRGLLSSENISDQDIQRFAQEFRNMGSVGLFVDNQA